MKYLLLIYDKEQEWGALGEAAQQAIYGEYRKLREELEASGQFVGGSQLAPTSTATSVRVRDDKQLVTDGPFAETHEQLGGYFLIEAKFERSIRIAGRVLRRRARSGEAMV